MEIFCNFTELMYIKHQSECQQVRQLIRVVFFLSIFLWYWDVNSATSKLCLSLSYTLGPSLQFLVMGCFLELSLGHSLGDDFHSWLKGTERWQVC